MKGRLIKRYKAFPIIQIETKSWCINILLWVGGKFQEWEIKKGFYNTTVKLYPIEFTVYH